MAAITAAIIASAAGYGDDVKKLRQFGVGALLLLELLFLLGCVIQNVKETIEWFIISCGGGSGRCNNAI